MDIIQDYIIGDARDTSKIIRDSKLPKPNLIISSPPYFDLINYDNNQNQIGYGSQDYETYLNIISQIYQDCYLSSTDDATFWLIVDTFKKDGERKLFPFDIVNKLKSNFGKTWLLKDIIIWDKEKNLPWNQKGNFKNQHEYILFFSKGENYKFNIDRLREIVDLKRWWKTYPERYNPDGKAPSNVWSFATPIRGWGENKQNHFCPLPFALVEKIIALCSNEGDFVFDPFAGSAAVLAIAKLMNRNSAGIDINKNYKVRFTEQVIDGAEKYWKKRVIELEKSNLLVRNFKDTNAKLRKLKVASSLSEYINKKNGHPYLMYAEDKNDNNIDIIFYKNGTCPDITIEDDNLQGLIHQSKVKPNIKIVDQSLIFDSLGSSEVYKYRSNKFYSYTSKCINKNILNSKDRYQYIYSNISIKVPNE